MHCSWSGPARRLLFRDMTSSFVCRTAPFLGDRTPGPVVIITSRHQSTSNSAPPKKMGFIGLGQMGSRMASNLLSKTDLPVLVYDINPEAMAILQGKGAHLASSVEEIAHTAQIIMTMLPATQYVEAVVGQVLIPHAKAGTLLIDGSTIDPTASKALAAQALARGLEMVDAPVSGGVGGAEAGTLTFMVGGEAKSVEKAEAFILKHMGKKVMHCGGAGTGAIAKICNNLVLGVNMVGVAEAMRLGVALGMDPLILNGVRFSLPLSLPPPLPPLSSA